MIAQVSGPVLQVGPTSAVIEVGGLGILALCSPNTVAGLRLGERATLATAPVSYTHLTLPTILLV